MRVRSSAHPIVSRVYVCARARVQTYNGYANVRVIRVYVRYVVCVVRAFPCCAAYERCTLHVHAAAVVRTQPSCHPLDVYETSIDLEGSHCLLRGIPPRFKGCATEIDSAVCHFEHGHDVNVLHRTPAESPTVIFTIDSLSDFLFFRDRDVRQLQFLRTKTSFREIKNMRLFCRPAAKLNALIISWATRVKILIDFFRSSIWDLIIARYSMEDFKDI